MGIIGLFLALVGLLFVLDKLATRFENYMKGEDD